MTPPERETSDAAARWAAERERLLELLAQQQRVAQTGLVTAGLIHDANNHLATMSGAAYLALGSTNPEDWRSALEGVQEQCSVLSETMRSFLAFVRRRDEDEIRSFRLSDAIEQATRLVGPLAHEHRVTVRADVVDDGEAAGHLRLAVQALVNLASNAIRACRANGGEVVLVASRPIDTTCRLEVRDTGPGIPEDIRRRIFRPFATQGDQGGHGLGLFVVRQTVRQMGGHIRVRTSPRGTTFTIDAPSA
jgi:signal transduction histidine kinase